MAVNSSPVTSSSVRHPRASVNARAHHRSRSSVRRARGPAPVTAFPRCARAPVTFPACTSSQLVDTPARPLASARARHRTCLLRCQPALPIVRLSPLSCLCTSSRVSQLPRTCCSCIRTSIQGFNRVSRLSNPSPTLSSYLEARYNILT
ncbi:hypothetical protein CRG98_019908 [Punica granatum]|uniref:Uncharacterized protein n=1 Tax=Punica granatum TaxID=22663 RepID=A0A2I0JTZ1_PUNGR|nr:hypothetical protein CRG98_019908 [Punica granatum]